MKITIATCQFPITSEIRRNLGYVKRQMKAARAKGADLAHFSECCLGGYAGVDLPSLEGYDWDLLQRSVQEVTELARELGLWLILGSNHRLSGDHRPHNSLYLIDPKGQIVDRYDKRFCTGSRTQAEDDLSHYSPGNRFVVFEVNGVRCGLQICHDFRYPELYREYKRREVQLMFHSYHNGGMTLKHKQDHHNVWSVLVRATMQTYAASNYMWISVNNTSRRESSGSSFVVATGRSDRWPAATAPSRSPDNDHRYRDALFRRVEGMAIPGDAWRVPQRHAGCRSAVGRPDLPINLV